MQKSRPQAPGRALPGVRPGHIHYAIGRASFLSGDPGREGGAFTLRRGGTVQFQHWLFAVAFATLAYGSLSDRYGHRPLLLCGLVLFLVGSAVSNRVDRACPRVQSRLARAAARRWCARSHTTLIAPGPCRSIGGQPARAPWSTLAHPTTVLPPQNAATFDAAPNSRRAALLLPRSAPCFCDLHKAKDRAVIVKVAPDPRDRSRSSVLDESRKLRRTIRHSFEIHRSPPLSVSQG